MRQHCERPGFRQDAPGEFVPTITRALASLTARPSTPTPTATAAWSFRSSSANARPLPQPLLYLSSYFERNRDVKEDRFKGRRFWIAQDILDVTTDETGMADGVRYTQLRAGMANSVLCPWNSVAAKL